MDQTICEAIGADLVKKFHTRDPFVIAEELGIHIYDSCSDMGDLKGLYTVIKRRRCIFLNKNLDEYTAKFVCAHEIGHDRLHRNLIRGNNCFQEFTLYNMASRHEYEANIVASAITLDDKEIMEYIRLYRFDAEQIAKAMHSDINLIALRISHLCEMGYNLRQLEHNSTFLK